MQARSHHCLHARCSSCDGVELFLTTQLQVEAEVVKLPQTFEVEESRRSFGVGDECLEKAQPLLVLADELFELAVFVCTGTRSLRLIIIENKVINVV